MKTSRELTHALVALVALVVMAGAALAQTPGPGTPMPSSPDNQLSDQRAGSVLVYNLYSSNAANPNAENTRLNITNTSSSSAAFVHLYFVDGNTCAPADAFICLTANQTASFLASDVDPGVTGYIIAMAVDGVRGFPLEFDFLIGDEYVKLASGHAANLGAEAIAVAISPLLFFAFDGASVRVEFDNICYNRVPRVLAVDNIPSPADGNDTLLVINRFGGNLLTGAASIGSVFAILYDDAETPFSLTFTGGCQFRKSINNANFRVLGGGVSGAIPSGRSGWMKFWSSSADDSFSSGGRALLGAAINKNSNASSSASAFEGGHNLHKLTLAPFASLIVPVFPPSC